MQKNSPLIEAIIQKQIIENKVAVKTRTNIIIPIVVHVVHYKDVEDISTLQIQSQINILNKDFQKMNDEILTLDNELFNLSANIGLQFCLASIDPDGQPTNGITRTKTSKAKIGTQNDIFSSINGGQDAWDTNKYLNIWVCDMSENLLGYANGPLHAPPNQEGVVVNYRYFGNVGTAYHSLPYHKGRTLTHEIGHFFHLHHLWGISEGDCDEDDLVADTPFQRQAILGCPSEAISCDSKDMVENFMGIADDDCMALFTKGQKERILATLFAFKESLILQEGCEANNTFTESLAVKIFPNPASHSFNVISEEEGQLFLNDLSGKNWVTQKIKKAILHSINIPKDIPKGLYIALLRNHSTHEIIFSKSIIIN